MAVAKAVRRSWSEVDEGERRGSGKSVLRAIRLCKPQREQQHKRVFLHVGRDHFKPQMYKCFVQVPLVDKVKIS